jgi:hypothetical protein
MVDAAVDSELFPENRTCHMSRFHPRWIRDVSVISYGTVGWHANSKKKGFASFSGRESFFTPNNLSPSFKIDGNHCTDEEARLTANVTIMTDSDLNFLEKPRGRSTESVVLLERG